MIIAGERRWRASQLAGLEEVPCIEMAVDAKGIAEIALIENLQRKDLTVWEEADGLAALKEKFGYTQDEIAQKISKGRTTVTELLTIAVFRRRSVRNAGRRTSTQKPCFSKWRDSFDEPAMFEFLDRIIGGKGEKKSPSTKASRKEPTEPRSSENNLALKGSRFQYEPDGAGFSIEVRFEEGDDLNKRSVLQALKQAFEDVKNDVVKI
jgi:ParB family chromosome partitioning protein